MSKKSQAKKVTVDPRSGGAGPKQPKTAPKRPHPAKPVHTPRIRALPVGRSARGE